MNDQLNSTPTVAVITSTIGRAELKRAILSVQAQTYPCKHYVFVDGKQFSEQARAILSQYPDVIATYLPMNTGANGWTNSSINAIAPFLVKEDIICYLDDDNWYDDNHIEIGVKTLLESGADYAYSLRKFYDNNQQYICEDVTESLGFYENKIGNLSYNVESGNKKIELNLAFAKKSHIDTNCYVMKHETAKVISSDWHSGAANDTNVFYSLNRHKFIGECTKHFSVNYLLDLIKYMPTYLSDFKEHLELSANDATKLGYELVKMINHRHLEVLDGKYPWEIEK